MRPKLLEILALGPDDLVGGLCKEIFFVADTEVPRYQEYDVYVECLRGEEGACRSSLHEAHLAMMQADGFEVLVIGGSVLSEDVEELLSAAPPDIEVENYAMPRSPLDQRVRYLFRSPNQFTIDGARALA